MFTILWLDDIRNPYLSPWKTDLLDSNKTIWVINYNQFTTWIHENGLPNIISFDHDLADEHYVPERLWLDYQASKDYQDSQDYTEKTGYDCAKWLVEYCIDRGLDLPIYIIHSMNPVGADNIRGLLDNYKKFRNDQQSRQNN